MAGEKVTAYITKYALTTGIQKVVGEIVEPGKRMLEYGQNYGRTYAHGNDWHLTLEEANAQANRMKEKKLISLRKSIERLEQMEFGHPLGVQDHE